MTAQEKFLVTHIRPTLGNYTMYCDGCRQAFDASLIFAACHYNDFAEQLFCGACAMAKYPALMAKHLLGVKHA